MEVFQRTIPNPIASNGFIASSLASLSADTLRFPSLAHKSHPLLKMLKDVEELARCVLGSTTKAFLIIWAC